MVKDWNESRTIILNGLSLLISLVLAIAPVFASDALGVSPETVRIAGIVLAVANAINLWLRAVTTQPVRLPGESVASAQERAP